jgi:outer membrane protein assembly factor BamA
MPSQKRLKQAVGHGLLILFLLGPIAGSAQIPADAFARGRSLYEGGDYAGAESLLRQILALGPETAELRHLIGMCAAFQGRLDEAEKELLAAIRIDPSFADSQIEIGGLYFKQKRYEESERALRRALKLRPEDAYARDLLGTVYFISGSQERALAEWNKVDKPVLNELVVSGDGVPHPELFKRELRVRPGQLIRPSGIRESRQRLDKVDCFADVSFALRPRPDSPDTADLLVSGREESGFGAGPAAVAVGGLRDVFHQTVYLDLKNISHRGVNLHAAYRWDPYQKLGELAVRAPRLLGTPLYYRLGYRDRRNRWFFEAPEGAGEDTEFSQAGREIRLDADHVVNGRISLDHHVILERNTYEPISGAAPQDSGSRFLWGGDYTFRLTDRPAPAPTATLRLHYDLGGSGGGEQKGFARSVLTAEIIKPWGPDLSRAASARLTGRVTWGLASAATPFDGYFVLGIGPDVEYLLRAYRTNAEGKLGSSPLGREFLLMNLDYLRGLGRLAVVRIEGGVFFDAGKVTGAAPFLQAADESWLTDAGVCLVARVFHVAFQISYAHSLVDGRQALYLSTTLD